MLEFAASGQLVHCLAGKLRARRSCGVDPKIGRHRHLSSLGEIRLKHHKGNTNKSMSTSRVRCLCHDMQSMVVWHMGSQRLVARVMANRFRAHDEAE